MDIVEWGKPMYYAVAIDMAIDALEEKKQMEDDLK